MATKTITITESAYNKLEKMKNREKESFSEVIINIPIKKKVKLIDFFGILSKESGKTLEENIKKAREHDKISERRKIKKIQEALE